MNILPVTDRVVPTQTPPLAEHFAQSVRLHRDCPIGLRIGSAYRTGSQLLVRIRQAHRHRREGHRHWLDPAEIKGWMKISEVLTAYKVPQADFYAAFGLPADMPLDTPLSTIEKTVTGFSVDQRANLADALGCPSSS